jgi:hypothetical protein
MCLVNWCKRLLFILLILVKLGIDNSVGNIVYQSVDTQIYPFSRTGSPMAIHP